MMSSPTEKTENAGEDMQELTDLAEFFKMFADSTRIRILYALFNKSLSVGSIAEALGMTESAISHQLRILRSGRLVRGRREGKQMIYSLDDDHVHTIIAMGLEHIEEL
ncbi:MAG: metalloregulator ArsR/SmtB family transcription factor [Eubacterium sp.]|nr:metalloregulator ArsR/SmtB family transcription factor [Eubacterium sp.]